MAARLHRYDLTESLNKAGINPDYVDRVLYAWGHGDEGYAEWEGGFILSLKDGRYVYVWGWCDTSGWGCQDGGGVIPFNHQPTIAEVVEATAKHDEAPHAADPSAWEEGSVVMQRWLEEDED
jgi:hypothetical protein